MSLSAIFGHFCRIQVKIASMFQLLFELLQFCFQEVIIFFSGAGKQGYHRYLYLVDFSRFIKTSALLQFLAVNVAAKVKKWFWYWVLLKSSLESFLQLLFQKLQNHFYLNLQLSNFIYHFRERNSKLNMLGIIPGVYRILSLLYEQRFLITGNCYQM